MSVIDEYLQNVPEVQRAELQRIRDLVHRIVPDATETISYGLPAFKYQSQPLVYFGAFKHHLSLFPTSGPTEAFKEQLAGYTVTRGTIQFSVEKPLPDQLLIEILEFRVAAIKQAHKQ